MPENSGVLISKDLQRIFGELLEEIEKTSGQKHVVSLCIFNTVPGSRMNYISNGSRIEIASAWQSLVRGWGEGMPDIPAHKIL